MGRFLGRKPPDKRVDHRHVYAAGMNQLSKLLAAWEHATGEKLEDYVRTETIGPHVVIELHFNPLGATSPSARLSVNGELVRSAPIVDISRPTVQ
jgi:hypothetical protein